MVLFQMFAKNGIVRQFSNDNKRNPKWMETNKFLSIGILIPLDKMNFPKSVKMFHHHTLVQLFTKYSILYYTSCVTKALSIAIRLNFTISGHLNKNFKVHLVTVLVNFSNAQSFQIFSKFQCATFFNSY